MLHPIVVDENGVIRHIVSDDMPQIDGNKTVRRASNVLPLHAWKRVAFVLLRQVFGDKGRVSDWTRTWSGPCVVEVIDGPLLGPFKDRETALQREVQWLERNRF